MVRRRNPQIRSGRIEVALKEAREEAGAAELRFPSAFRINALRRKFIQFACSDKQRGGEQTSDARSDPRLSSPFFSRMEGACLTFSSFLTLLFHALARSSCYLSRQSRPYSANEGEAGEGGRKLVFRLESTLFCARQQPSSFGSVLTLRQNRVTQYIVIQMHLS